jgi:hypothetical protein
MGILDGLLGNSIEQWTGLPKAELSEWAVRARDMAEWWTWFSGEALREENRKAEPDENGKYPLKYPLQINPITSAARLHSFALWGEVPDNADPLVRTIVEPPERDEEGKVSDEHKTLVKHLEDVLERVFYENNTRSMFMDVGLTSQILGGTVLKVGYESDNPQLPTGIRLEYFKPQYFHARWRGQDFWNLTEAWIKYEVSQAQAALYGVDIQGKTGMYVEYWTPKHYRISIDGHVARLNDKLLEEDHHWGIVPLAYIPHERAGDFWGRSLVPEAVGLVEELNAREADVGDAVHLGVHSLIAIWNTKGGHPAVKRLNNGMPWLDLGKAISQGDPQPGAERLDPPNLPVGTMDFNSSLKDQIKAAVITPPIAYGEEEGSQRSGETLFQRMWPMLSHMRSERTNWTTGLNKVCQFILTILASKSREAVKPEHALLRMRQKWAPMVPVDRAKLVDEVVRRLESKGISYELAVELLGDAEDNTEEVNRIWAQIERMAEIDAKAKTQVAEVQADAALEQAKLAAETQTDLAPRTK